MPVPLHSTHMLHVYGICAVSADTRACACADILTHSHVCAHRERANVQKRKSGGAGRERERERERERPALALMGTEGGAFALLAVCPLPLVLADARPFAADEKKRTAGGNPDCPNQTVAFFFHSEEGGKEEKKKRK